MKQAMKMLIAFCLFGYGTGMHAQETVATGGITASGAGGSVICTVGQIAYTTKSGTNGTVAEGVQQPYEISIITVSEEMKGAEMSLTVHPNPATHYLILTTQGCEKCTYTLYSTDGKVLATEKIINSEILISLETYQSSTYILNITQEEKIMKTFKITKN